MKESDKEAKRWLLQAEDDLRFVEAALRDANKVFQAARGFLATPNQEEDEEPNPLRQD